MERLHLRLQLEAAPENKRTLRPASPLSDFRSILSLLRLHLQADPYRLEPMIIDPDSMKLRRNQPPPLRPDSSPPLLLRRLRPPAPISIRADEIVSCAGPWRSSGDWWKEDPEERWSRDEWDVELADGRIYRIYWDQDEREWFLEGVYD